MSDHPVRKVVHFGAKYAIRLRWAEREAEGDAYWVDFEMFRNVSLDPPMEFHARNRADFTQDMDQADRDATGYVKWDGCTQVDVSTHVCEGSALDALCGALRYARAEAYAASRNKHDPGDERI